MSATLGCPRRTCPPPLDVLNLDLGHLGAHQLGERRDKAMLLTEETEVRDQIAPVASERGAEVVNLDAADAADEQVGDTGRPAADDPFLALVPPAAHEVVPLVELRQKRGDVLGKMLQIGVHRNDHVARGRRQAGLQRRGLPEIAPQLNERACALLGERNGYPQGPSVLPSSTTRNSTDRSLRAGARGRDAPDEFGQGAGLVVLWRDNVKPAWVPRGACSMATRSPRFSPITVQL